ncbi:MAG: hypothetical protein Q7T16_05870 [Candidatus Burarchaeum sp.]|nr:hypothetical protein [Candidatus Burarchaeum sp.]MDO8340154.1 hypothetical protein [Candidatus Burarchaeum sp.]
MNSIIGKLEILLGTVLLLGLTPLPFFNQLVRSGMTWLVEFFPLGEMLAFSLLVLMAVAILGLFLVLLALVLVVSSLLVRHVLKLPGLAGILESALRVITKIITFREWGGPLAEQLTGFYNGLGATALYAMNGLMFGFIYVFILRILFHTQDFDLGTKAAYFSQLAGSQPAGLLFVATLGWYLLIAGLADHGYYLMAMLRRH